MLPQNNIPKGVGRKLLKLVLSRWKLLTVTLILTSIVSYISTIFPYLTREAINLLYAGKIEDIWFYAVLVVVLTIIQGLASYGKNVFSEYTGQSIVYELRNRIYAHLNELSLGFFDRIESGQIIARATSDVEDIRRFIGFGIPSILNIVVMFVFSIAMMLIIDVELTLVTLSIFPLMVLFVRYSIPKYRAYVAMGRNIYSEMTTAVKEAATGIKVIKSYVLGDYFASNFRSKLLEYFNMDMKTSKLRAIIWPSMGWFVYLTIAIIYWYGGLRAISGDITIGDVVAFTLYILFLNRPIMLIGYNIVRYQRALVATKRIFDILEAEPEVRDLPDAEDIEIKRGSIRFENVWFSYDGKNYVLKGLNLEIKPGEIVALTGPTGSGKSTIAQLIMRLYDPQKGRILIDGVDVKRFKLESLRRQIGMVHQDVFLFPDTIRNNIAFGAPDTSIEDVVRVAKLAHIHDFISSLPKGYDTNVGERGVTLSGGQRQRLSIARALMINPKIIILDDSTSQVDAKTEAAIYDALTKHFRGKTVIVITQRIPTLKLVDRIIVISDGEIVEEGSFSDLIEKGKLFPKLFKAGREEI